MKILLAAILCIPLAFSCLSPRGGDPVQLPAIEQMSDAQFGEVCLHVKIFTRDSVVLLLETGRASRESVLDLANMMQIVLVSEGVLNDPHLFTKFIDSTTPKGRALLSTVILAEDLIRLHWDTGLIGFPLSDRTKILLQAIVDAFKDATFSDSSPSTNA